MSEHDSKAAQRRRPRIRIALVLGAVTASLFSGLLLAPAAQAAPGERPGNSAVRHDERDGPQRNGRQFRKCFTYKYEGTVRNDGRRIPYSARLSWCAKRNGQVEGFRAETRGPVRVSATTARGGERYRVRIEAGRNDNRTLILNNRGGVFPERRR